MNAFPSARLKRSHIDLTVSAPYVDAILPACLDHDLAASQITPYGRDVMVHRLLSRMIVVLNKGSEAGVTHVLILEDNDENRSFLRMLFEGEGYRVATAANGADGLRWLSHHPAPSVIVLDLNMPVMNGWEFCAALQGRAHLAQIPLVVLSGEADGGAAARSLPVPAAYLAKPAIPDVLVQTIANHIQAGDRTTPNLDSRL